MIVVDLDGTVLNSERKITSKTKEYLKKLKDKGYVITIATGRIYASVLDVTDGAEFANYIITDTGACTYNAVDGNEIFTNFIDRKTVEKFFKYYNENCHYIDICNKNTIYKFSDEVEDYSFIKTTKDKDLILNECNNVNHISICMKNNDDVITLYNKLIKDFLELDILIMQDSFADKKWIETMKKGCSKYNAISELAKSLNINNDEIIAFGDGLNDVEMLEKCGYGVALKNALDEVKKVSNDVTTYDHNNDGAVKYLEEYLNEY